MAKTMKDLLEEFRIKAGALEYKGHEYLDLKRFADDTKHMIIFDVVKDDCSWGEKGDRMRLYLNDVGYGKAVEFQKKGSIRVKSYAKVHNGKLDYDNYLLLR